MPKIDCKFLNQKTKTLVNTDGSVWPCCYLGNYNWDKDAATLASLKLNDILNVVESLDSSIDRDSLKQKIQNPDDITIKGDLIPEFIES